MDRHIAHSFIFKDRRGGETLQPVVIGMHRKSLEQVEGIVYPLLNSSTLPKDNAVFLTSAYQ